MIQVFGWRKKKRDQRVRDRDTETDSGESKLVGGCANFVTMSRLQNRKNKRG